MIKVHKINKLAKTFLIVIFFIASNLVFGQSLSYVAKSGSKVIITGTSSLHDWLMEAEVKNCEIQLIEGAESFAFELHNVEFQLPVVQLKSEHSKMDGNAQKALKFKKFPNIIFTISEVQNIVASEEGVQNPIKGVLEIAGIKKAVVLNAVVKVNADSSLEFHFTHPIHMEDYAVEPPSFMFGAVTTGSDIQAEFSLNFNK